MNDTVMQLESLGLGKTESELYLAGMAYKHAVGVSELQKRTGLKRPTIYHNLNLLASKGLASKVSSLNRTLYAFSGPEQLERMIESEVREAKAKARTLAQVMKSLEDLRPADSGTSVRHFEGIQGIKTVVDMALFCQHPEWRIISPVDNFFRQFDARYARYYMITRKRHGIKSKTLWELPGASSRPLTKQEIRERNPRFLPQSMHGKFAPVTILFDNKVAIITSLKEESAILIESNELSELFEALFEALWTVSTPYGDAIKPSSSPSR